MSLERVRAFLGHARNSVGNGAESRSGWRLCVNIRCELSPVDRNIAHTISIILRDGEQIKLECSKADMIIVYDGERVVRRVLAGEISELQEE